MKRRVVFSLARENTDKKVACETRGTRTTRRPHRIFHKAEFCQRQKGM